MSQYKTDAPHSNALRKLTLCAAASLLICTLGTSDPAHAQVPQAAKDIADPSRVDEQFRSSDIDFEVGPSIEVREADVEKAPAGSEKITLTLKELQISGASVYTQDYLESFYADKLGTTVSLADIYAIAARLTKLYRDDDYAISRVVVPVQTIDKKSGVIKLEAVEGFISNVTLQGEDHGAEFKRIRQYVQKIQNVQPLNIKDLERVLLMINDLPGVEARAIMAQSENVAKASDLTLVISRKKWDGLISYDTHGSRYLGPHQFIGASSFNSWLGLNERFTLQGAYAPDSDFDPELAYGSAYYEQPINKHGTWLKVFLSKTSTKPGFDLERFDVQGNSTYGEIKLVHPIVRTRNYNWYTDLAFDWRNANSKNNIEPTRKDRIRAVRLGTNVEILDTLFKAGVNSMSLKYSRGLNVFGASEKNNPNLSRQFGDPEFTKFEAEFQRLQRLSNKWNILAAVKGQLTNGAQLSSEEFGVGGVNIGRSFDSSEIVGDEGYAGKVELQWRTPYQLPLFDTYQLYGFYDFGRVWNDDATTNDLKRESLASAGIGLNGIINEKTKLGMILAYPLTRDVQTQRDDDPRFYFSVSREF
jgi:hemolysin activation/secretion protein